MNGQRNVNFFLRSNPRTSRAIDRFIGGGRRRQPSERVIPFTEVDDGNFTDGGVWTPRGAMQDTYTETEEIQTPRWFGHKQRAKMHQGPDTDPRPRDSGYLGDSPVWITLHHQEDINLTKEQEIVMAEDGVCPYKHTNKMAGMASINVSTNNPFCERMRAIAKEREAVRNRLRAEGRDPDAMGMRALICAGCYAHELEGRPSVKKRFEENRDLLGSRVLEIDEIPVFKPGEVIRFHAFGDMINPEHFANMFNIVNRNPESYFTIWSKNFELFHQYLVRSGNAKPKNLTIIYSGGEIDVIRIDPLFHGPMQAYIDGSFNVVRTKDLNQLVYGDIMNFERYFPGVDPETPIRYGHDATLNVTFVYCDAFCINCKRCYSGITRFVVIEDFRRTRGKDPFAQSSKRRTPGITMTRMGFSVTRHGGRSSRAIAAPPRRTQATPRRQVRDDRYRRPPALVTRR